MKTKYVIVIWLVSLCIIGVFLSLHRKQRRLVVVSCTVSIHAAGLEYNRTLPEETVLSLPRVLAQWQATRESPGPAQYTVSLRLSDGSRSEVQFSAGGQVVNCFGLLPDRDALWALVMSISKEYFGEPVSWRDALRLFTKKSVAQVVDLQTGKRFSVRRYGGSYHADVEPVTAPDAAVLFEIYGGWSWRRRPILLLIDGRRIAASMNGMPHGDQDIMKNDFPGHFCIHFDGSTTHGSRLHDIAHQAMVDKAAGTLLLRLERAGPREVAELYLALINEKDTGTLRLLCTSASLDWLTANVDYLRVLGLGEPVETEEGVNITADVLVRFEKGGSSRRTKLPVILGLTPGGRWVVKRDPIRQLWEQENRTRL
ncbi:MAG: hypothetical protein AB1497_04170 [Bacillota bacterium]